MTQDEIIEMARQAGFDPHDMSSDFTCNLKDINAFAKLVAQHTLANIDPSKFISFQEGVEAGRLAEREACAQLADEWHEKRGLYGMDYFAKAIRARGEA